jgi:hypothetical protein
VADKKMNNTIGWIAFAASGSRKETMRLHDSMMLAMTRHALLAQRSTELESFLSVRVGNDIVTGNVTQGLRRVLLTALPRLLMELPGPTEADKEQDLFKVVQQGISLHTQFLDALVNISGHQQSFDSLPFSSAEENPNKYEPGSWMHHTLRRTPVRFDHDVSMKKYLFSMMVPDQGMAMNAAANVLNDIIGLHTADVRELQLWCDDLSPEDTQRPVLLGEELRAHQSKVLERHFNRVALAYMPMITATYLKGLFGSEVQAVLLERALHESQAIMFWAKKCCDRDIDPSLLLEKKVGFDPPPIAVELIDADTLKEIVIVSTYTNS